MTEPTFRPGSDEEWHALMQRLRRQPAAQPRPFFYARVRARLLHQAAATGLPAWLRRPLYAAALGALVLAVSGDGPVVPVSAGAPGSYSAPRPPQ